MYFRFIIRTTQIIGVSLQGYKNRLNFWTYDNIIQRDLAVLDVSVVRGLSVRLKNESADKVFYTPLKWANFRYFCNFDVLGILLRSKYVMELNIFRVYLQETIWRFVRNFFSFVALAKMPHKATDFGVSEKRLFKKQTSGIKKKYCGQHKPRFPWASSSNNLRLPEKCLALYNLLLVVGLQTYKIC